MEIKGTTYKKKSIVVIEMNLLPVSGVIEDIIVLDTDYYFVCSVYKTNFYFDHFHAFEVCEQSPLIYHVCKQTELYDYTPLSAYKINSNTYIALKYQLIELF